MTNADIDPSTLITVAIIGITSILLLAIAMLLYVCYQRRLDEAGRPGSHVLDAFFACCWCKHGDQHGPDYATAGNVSMSSVVIAGSSNTNKAAADGPVVPPNTSTIASTARMRASEVDEMSGSTVALQQVQARARAMASTGSLALHGSGSGSRVGLGPTSGRVAASVPHTTSTIGDDTIMPLDLPTLTRRPGVEQNVALAQALPISLVPPATPPKESLTHADSTPMVFQTTTTAAGLHALSITSSTPSVPVAMRGPPGDSLVAPRITERGALAKRVQKPLARPPVIKAREQAATAKPRVSVMFGSGPSEDGDVAGGGYNDPTMATLVSEQTYLAFPAFLEFQPGVDYRTVRQIARGGMGLVLLCEVVSAELRLKSLGDGSEERAVSYHIKDHVNIAKAIGFSIKGPEMTMLMRFYECGSLFDLTMRRREVPFEWTTGQVYDFAKDIASGLQHLHERKIAHCDIKSQNILVYKEGTRYTAVLTDFGISKILDGKQNIVSGFQSVRLVGVSISYAAPEAILAFQNKLVMSLSSEELKAGDVYSFAAVLFEMITKRKPWH